MLRRRLLIAAIVALGLAVTWLVGPRMLRGSCYVVIRNASVSDLSDVEVAVRYHRGGADIERSSPRLGPGEELRVRHGLTDSALRLRFVLNGVPRLHEELYIDLWRGEGWRVEVGSDGIVRSGYDRPGHVLQERDPPNPALQPTPQSRRG